MNYSETERHSSYAKSSSLVCFDKYYSFMSNKNELNPHWNSHHIRLCTPHICCHAQAKSITSTLGIITPRQQVGLPLKRRREYLNGGEIIVFFGRSFAGTSQWVRNLRGGRIHSKPVNAHFGQLKESQFEGRIWSIRTTVKWGYREIQRNVISHSKMQES